MWLLQWRDNKFGKFYLKWLLWQPATPLKGFRFHLWHWRHQFLLFCKPRFDFQTGIHCKFLFRSVQLTKVLSIKSCFSVLVTGIIWISHYFAPNPLSNVTWHMLKCNDILPDCITTLLVFDYLKQKVSREVTWFNCRRLIKWALLTQCIKHLTGQLTCVFRLLIGECNGCCIL